jgi:hypothetical protein
MKGMKISEVQIAMKNHVGTLPTRKYRTAAIKPKNNSPPVIYVAPTNTSAQVLPLLGGKVAIF